MRVFADFITNESGAVTVDWVVLTSAVVGLGLAVMSVVSTGLESLSTKIAQRLCGVTISTSFNTVTASDPAICP